MSADKILVKAIEAHRSGQITEAEALYNKVLSIKKNDTTALHHLGVAAYQRRDLTRAADFIRKALRLKPDFPEALNNLGNVLKDQGKLDDAVDAYRQSLRYMPKNPETNNNLGIVLLLQGKAKEAEACYHEALRLAPDYADAYYNFGNVLVGLGKLEAAAATYQEGIRRKPDFPEAYNNLGNTLKEQGKLAEAAASYEQAIRYRANFPEAYNNLGGALLKLGDEAKAIAAFQTAIRLRPAYPEAHYNLGCAFEQQIMQEDAVAAFKEALRLNPDYAQALSSLTYQQKHLCDWHQYEANEQQIKDIVQAGIDPISPFAFVVLSSEPQEQLACARTWSARLSAPKGPYFPKRQSRRDGPIRIGYLSADLHRHATAFLMAELFERHDRSKFEVIAYSYGPNDSSDVRRRLEGAFDRFVDVRSKSHAEIATAIYEDEIDILVDLKGYTQHARTDVLTFRPAPIQVNYLGYPGTMGSELLDYIIADPFVVPMDQQPHFSERLVHLPDCYQPNDTKREIAERTPSRAECGLPEQGFVFCSFNSTYKITPTFFALWMRLLKATPGSVLWLLQANRSVKDNLRREAMAHGVDPDRLVFASVLPLADHLARHRLADLFLDTMPVNAHTTASDALWAGLPLLTCAGNTFVSRVAGSLLRAVGLPELITTSVEDYEALALRLAHTPELLRELRQKLARNRLSAPLFDIARFTRNIESAYTRMWEIWQAGEEPKAFAIAAPDAESAPEKAPAPVPPPAAAERQAARVLYEACPLCDAKDVSVLGQADCSLHPSYHPAISPAMVWCRCAVCGHVFTDGYFTDEAARLVFSKILEHQAVGHGAETQRPVSARIVERVARHAIGGAWLDVGFGNGSLLFTAEEWGYTPVGLDLREQNVQALRRLGYEAHCLSVEALDQPGRFSVVSMADVLEHMPYPKVGLAAARTLLRPGGALFLSMPNMDSMVWRLLGEANANPYWAEIEHYHNFGRQRLSSLLSTFGFETVNYSISERYRVCMEIIAVKQE